MEKRKLYTKYYDLSDELCKDVNFMRETNAGYVLNIIQIVPLSLGDGFAYRLFYELVWNEETIEG